MKAALILVAIALALGLGLLMGHGYSNYTYSPSREFTLAEEFEVRERFPGGTLVNHKTAYRICEGGYEVRLYPDGLKLFFNSRACWR